jgi:glucose/arabinose dehydrogenase
MSRLATAAAALAGAAALAALIVVREVAPAQRLPASGEAFAADQRLGKQFRISVDDLPPPKPTSVSNGPRTLLFDGQTLTVPEGFTATLYAKLENPRRLLVLPNGDIIVAEQRPGHLTLLHGRQGNGRAERIERVAEGFNEPYGLAWRDDHLLVADQDGIWKVARILDALHAGRGLEGKAADVASDRQKPSHSFAHQTLITKRGVFGIARGHANRPLAIDRSTGQLFVGVGSMGNVGIEPEVKATIQRFAPDGTGQVTFVSGARNTCGLAIHPDTGKLWAVVQERDGLGDRLPPDYLVQPELGAFYGWPYAYTGQHPQPGYADRAPEKVTSPKVPDLLFEAHSSALDLIFYDGAQFPSEYRGDAFVALRGSWNRSQPTGYKVVRVPFKQGRPQGFYENFATGFWAAGVARAEIWGRPAAVAVAKDGALLIADDAGGTIWRVAYVEPRDRATGSGER